MTRRLSLLIAAAAALVVLVPSGASANAPVLTGPDSSWSTAGTITDPHVNAACAADPSAPLPIIEAVCPEFPIVLDGNDAHPLRYLDITLHMTATAANRTVEDFDLYLLDANGAEIDSSANAVGTQETIARNLVPDGNYTIRVVPFTNLPGSRFTLDVRFRTTTT